MASMRNARIVVIVMGVLLPFAARLPGGLDWMGQYLQGSVGLLLLVSGFNAIAWGAILACSLAYKRPASLVLPALFGFAFLAWGTTSWISAQTPRRRSRWSSCRSTPCCRSPSAECSAICWTGSSGAYRRLDLLAWRDCHVEGEG